MQLINKRNGEESMEEMIDVLDENGIKTGEVLTRKEVHKRGLWHRVIVVAIIDNKDRILVQQRSYQKDTNPGKWDVSAAGHVSAGQSSLEATLREIEEEVGICLQNENLQYIFTCKKETRPKENHIAKHFNDFYIARVKEIDMEHITLQESEVENAKLVTKEEFKDMVEHENMVNREDVYNKVIEYLFKDSRRNNDGNIK